MCPCSASLRTMSSANGLRELVMSRRMAGEGVGPAEETSLSNDLPGHHESSHRSHLQDDDPLASQTKT